MLFIANEHNDLHLFFSHTFLFDFDSISLFFFTIFTAATTTYAMLYIYTKIDNKKKTLKSKQYKTENRIYSFNTERT